MAGLGTGMAADQDVSVQAGQPGKIMSRRLYCSVQICISTVPGLFNLLREGEELADLMKLSPEQILLRWVNHQLEKVLHIHVVVVYIY